VASNDVMVIGTVLLVERWSLPVKMSALLVEHPSLVAKVAGTTATAATAVLTAAAAVTMTAAGNALMTAMMTAEVIAMATVMMTVVSGLIVISTAAIGMLTAVIATQTVMIDTATAMMTGGATAIEDHRLNLQQQARVSFLLREGGTLSLHGMFLKPMLSIRDNGRAAQLSALCANLEDWCPVVTISCLLPKEGVDLHGLQQRTGNVYVLVLSWF